MGASDSVFVVSSFLDINSITSRRVVRLQVTAHSVVSCDQRDRLGMTDYQGA